MTVTALIASSDARLRDDLLRLAAAADAPAEIARHPDHVRARWHRAGLVLVGDDLAADLAGVPRRGGVALVTRAGDPDVYRRALAIGAQDLVVLPDDEPWLLDALSSAAEPVDGDGVTVCVTGARGGAGTSVLAASLALTAARAGRRTLLVDADPAGGELDVLLGLEDEPGARWHELAARRGRLSPSTLREALPSVGEFAVLTGAADTAVSGDAAASVLDAAARGFDLTVVDVPRAPGPVGTPALRAASVTYVVLPAEVRPALAARRHLRSLTDLSTDVRLIVTTPSPGGLSPQAVADGLPVPLAGALEHDSRLRTSLEHGDLVHCLRRGPLMTLCESLLSTLTPTTALREAA
ncbi:septum site-determining protein Ssd [Actinomadura flavalba]|uniref:septum site-determining protein Ssd n=1 Tax=Actinomadura flavalba TaxID=1120938 RepID=UPI000364E212|nr:septum site-determining protein Ssd [Actinomadura flavalba]